MSDPPALRLDAVDLVEGSTTVLREVDWTVRQGERWVVLGPNGAGKTSLLRVAALRRHPTRGEIEVLGGRLGRVDVRALRRRIGLASQALADLLRPDLTSVDVVMTARHGALEPWWHTYGDDDRQAAARLLDEFGVGGRAAHRVGTLSAGERQRVLLARAFAGDPGLVLLDEPTAGLDVGGREDLVARLGRFAARPATPPVVLVTHHLEEIPAGFTHALLLSDGAVAAQGPLPEVVTSARLSEVFGLALTVERRGERFAAWSGDAGQQPRT